MNKSKDSTALVVIGWALVILMVIASVVAFGYGWAGIVGG